MDARRLIRMAALFSVHPRHVQRETKTLDPGGTRVIRNWTRECNSLWQRVAIINPPGPTKDATGARSYHPLVGRHTTPRLSSAAMAEARLRSVSSALDGEPTAMPPNPSDVH